MLEWEDNWIHNNINVQTGGMNVEYDWEYKWRWNKITNWNDIQKYKDGDGN